MKSISVIALCLLMLFSCKDKPKNEPKNMVKVTRASYKLYGKDMIVEDAIAAKSMVPHYQTMYVGDSVPSKIMGKVKQVCQAKGCWMRLDLEDDKTIMVKFKDYGFFVPKDISGKQVIVNGKAFVKEVSIEEQQHYAKDAGKSESEIASIVKSNKTYLFEADGVLIAK
ncbi:DUF4920 domain-containing protein [uncultured Algibacter sp.]|uniref:DUF4920 domain-containing protein n=1 Tax=uncultured Algibacter sp. TaxID=298659 RepID=UPI003217256F